MKPYRPIPTVQAVRYLGVPITDVTCEGTDAQWAARGCDERRFIPHVHTFAPGGLTCLNFGDWILPVAGGPFSVIPDLAFRPAYETTDDLGMFIIDTIMIAESSTPAPNTALVSAIDTVTTNSLNQTILPSWRINVSQTATIAENLAFA